MRVSINPCHSWSKSNGSPREQALGTIEQARVAASYDYEGFWLPHSYLNTGFNRFRPIPMLARLLGVTDEIDVGLVYIVTLEHPVAIAEDLSTLAHLTDGSLTVAAVQGYVPEHFEAFGIPKRERTERFVEAIDFLRKLWTEQSVTFDGKYYSVENASVNPKADISVFIGANAGRAVERAGTLGEGWLISNRTSIEDAEELAERYRAGASKSSWPDRGISMYRRTYVAETTEQAEEHVRPMIQSRVETYRERGASDIDGDSDIDSLVDAMMGDHIIGSPEECIERIRHLEREIGVDELICSYGLRELSSEKQLNSIELFGEEVLPAVTA